MNWLKRTTLLLTINLVTPFLCSIPVTDKNKPGLEFQVQNPIKQHSKVKVLMLTLGDNPLLDKIAKIVQFDLEFSDQMEIDLKKSKTALEPKVLAKIFTQGTSLCLYLEESNQVKKNKDTLIKIMLKEPSSNETLFEKTVVCPERSLVHCAHSISDELMPILTGEKGPMLSTLAYCKQVNNKYKVVCLTDLACKIEKTVVAAKTTNIAPCWHSKAPVLFYSQFTKVNSRLMSVDLRSRAHRVICSYDGLNMQPSFSPDGVKAALCLSGKGNSEVYLYDQAICSRLKKRVFKPLTNNKGNNSSPCLLPDNNIIFCSDFQTGQPQIYYQNTKTKITRRLTNGRGYCAAPTYSPKINTVAYTRYVKGCFQIFCINLNEKKLREHQITFNPGNKVEPTWSECGRYVAFTYGSYDTVSKKLTNQIAVHNLASGKMRILTTGPEHKSFPAWTGQSLYQA